MDKVYLFIFIMIMPTAFGFLIHRYIKKNAVASLKLLKDISRKIEASEISHGNREIDRIRRDVQSGMRVGFFIKGKPVVARLSPTGSGEIEVIDLESE